MKIPEQPTARELFRQNVLQLHPKHRFAVQTELMAIRSALRRIFELDAKMSQIHRDMKRMRLEDRKLHATAALENIMGLYSLLLDKGVDVQFETLCEELGVCISLWPRVSMHDSVSLPDDVSMDPLQQFIMDIQQSFTDDNRQVERTNTFARIKKLFGFGKS